jgi:hypothetical protein
MNHVAWPHYGPGNMNSKANRYGAFFAFALDDMASRHTTSERVYHGHTFRSPECYQYETPVGDEKIAFALNTSVAAVRNAVTLASLSNVVDAV